MRRSPGWFNPRNSGVWWNCRRSAVSIIGTSDERHSHSVLFGRSLTLRLAVASLKKIGQANQPIRRSVEKITSADSVLEIEPQRTSSGRNFSAATAHFELSGFGYHNHDFTIMKNFRIKESVNFQLRGEFFNVWNWHTFNCP